MRLVLLVAAIVTLAACYTYRPASVETVPAGAEIRGLLGTPARIGIEDRLRLRLDYLNGRLVERSGDSMLVEVRSLSATDGRPLYQRIGLAQADVLRVDVKRLDKVRTLALVAGVATVAIIAVVQGFWSTGGGDGGGGGPPEAPPAGGGSGPVR